MKNWIIEVDGIERETIKAGSMGTAMKKARKWYGGKRMGKDAWGKNALVEKDIRVIYTEI